MPIRTTLADLQSSAVGAALGILECDPRFIALANRAQRSLADGGRWYGTVVVMRFCQYGGCITFPREVAVVEKMDICRQSTYIRNQWWEFQTDYPVPPVGTTCLQKGWTRELLDRGNACTFQDVVGAPAFIQLYPQSVADVGKVIVLQGIDAGTLNPVSESVTLPASGYVQSAYQYLPPGLTGVIKPVTTGQINVTAYYPAQIQYAAIGLWEASETNPWYVRKYLLNFPQCCQSPPPGPNNFCTDYGTGCAPALVNCQNGITATFLVRREFIPALVPTDWMFIQNIEAVREEMLALNARDQHQFELSEPHHQQALRYLRNELDKYQPPQQITVNAQPWGDAHPGRIFAGFM